MRDGWWIDLGQVDYGAAHALQLRLIEARQRDEVPDLLLLCEHPPVITVGRRLRAQANILDPRFPVHEVERGGDATYHGPGQLVGYPILKLEGADRDLHRYLRDLEQGLIGLCAGLGVPAGRREGWTGVWTADQERKVASIGIAVRRWVTFHGFALNVTTDLSHFHAIHPCGLLAQVMTSLAQEGGRLDRGMEGVQKETILALGEALRRRFSAAPKNVPTLG